jgi:hypothetical protein
MNPRIAGVIVWGSVACYLILAAVAAFLYVPPQGSIASCSCTCSREELVGGEK